MEELGNVLDSFIAEINSGFIKVIYMGQVLQQKASHRWPLLMRHLEMMEMIIRINMFPFNSD